jgi:hypothetical protein
VPLSCKRLSFSFQTRTLNYNARCMQGIVEVGTGLHRGNNRGRKSGESLRHLREAVRLIANVLALVRKHGDPGVFAGEMFARQNDFVAQRTVFAPDISPEAGSIDDADFGL